MRTYKSLSWGGNYEVGKEDLKGMQAEMLSERIEVVSQVFGSTQRGRWFGLLAEMAHLLVKIMIHSNDINVQL